MNEPLQLNVRPDGVVVLRLCGDLSEERLSELTQAIEADQGVLKEQFHLQGKGLRILFDLSEFSGVYSAKAVAEMARFAKGNTEMVLKTACFGGPKTVQMAAEVVVALSGRDNIKFFETQEEAEAWLREDKKKGFGTHITSLFKKSS